MSQQYTVIHLMASAKAAAAAAATLAAQEAAALTPPSVYIFRHLSDVPSPG